MLLCVGLISSCGNATDNNPVDGGSTVIVSLGDSYSSGEGNPPFYGQKKELSTRVADLDWLAHRSENSWSGMLRLPSLDKSMSEYKGKNWFFVASSGATTEDMLNSQRKNYRKIGLQYEYYGSEDLEPQLDVFKNMGDLSADYVTLTLGGNDAGFSSIVTAAASNISYLDRSNKLEKALDKIDFEHIYTDLKKTYRQIYDSAGKQAAIIVAGYPTLISESGSILFFDPSEANMMNEVVRKFNSGIEEAVNDCKNENINIYFVSVEDKFKGHEAYALDSYINGVMLQKSEDLDDGKPISDYSVHPNEKGVKAYAECVQEKINQLEEEKAKILSETQESSDKKETQTEEDDGTAGLVGTWGSDSLHWSAPSLMVLHQDGTCMLDGLSSYTWSVKSGVITFEDSVGVGYKKEHNYEIHGDILTLEDEENGKCIYNRK